MSLCPAGPRSGHPSRSHLPNRNGSACAASVKSIYAPCRSSLFEGEKPSTKIVFTHAICPPRSAIRGPRVPRWPWGARRCRDRAIARALVRGRRRAPRQRTGTYARVRPEPVEDGSLARWFPNQVPTRNGWKSRYATAFSCPTAAEWKRPSERGLTAIQEPRRLFSRFAVSWSHRESR